MMARPAALPGPSRIDDWVALAPEFRNQLCGLLSDHDELAALVPRGRPDPLRYEIVLVGEPRQRGASGERSDAYPDDVFSSKKRRKAGA